MPTLNSHPLTVLEVGPGGGDLAYLRDLLAIVPPGESTLPATAGGQLLSLLQHAGLRTVIRESDYRDVDFTASFARIYFRRHHETDRRCTRLHFFRCEIREAELKGLRCGSKEIVSQLERSYLGYIVLRPLESAKLGRSVLAASLQPSVAAGRSCLTCVAKFPVNLLGSTLCFIGIPWIQQDQVVSTCASAALWVVSEYMSYKFAPAFRRYTTAEITDLAGQSPNEYGRALPSSGLTLEQMHHGLMKMGYEPVGKSPEDAAHARTEISYYVESGLPVVLSLLQPNMRVGHAIAVVGYVTNENLAVKVNSDKTGFAICRASDFVSDFIAQDDDRGPLMAVRLMDHADAYRDKEIKKFLPRDRQDQGSCFAVIRGADGRIEVFYLIGLTMPFPPGVSLEGACAEAKVIDFVTNCYSKPFKSNNPLVVRSFLHRSNDIKKYWAEQCNRPTAICSVLRPHLFSRWVWVTELTSLYYLRNGKKALGQVIQDCSGFLVEISSSDFLLWHMPSTVCSSGPVGRSDLQTIDPPYDPYPRYELGYGGEFS